MIAFESPLPDWTENPVILWAVIVLIILALILTFWKWHAWKTRALETYVLLEGSIKNGELFIGSFKILDSALSKEIRSRNSEYVELIDQQDTLMAMGGR